MQKNKNIKKITDDQKKLKQAFLPPELTAAQEKLANDVVSIIRSGDNGKMLIASAAPGSGKTTCIVETVRRALHFIDGENKIMLLAFNTKMKDEIIEKLKKSGISLDKVDVSTIHAMFRRKIAMFDSRMIPKNQNQNFSKKRNQHSTFQIENRGFFTKKMIHTALNSMKINGTKYSSFIEGYIDKNRKFSDLITDDHNIKVLTKFVNAYYSSPIKMNDIWRLGKIAHFFAKNESDNHGLESILLSQEDKNIIKKEYSTIATKNYTPEQVFLFYLIYQIDTLAKLKDEIQIGETKRIINKIPMEIIDKDNNRSTRMHEFITEEKNVEYEHIYSIPHCFYYKEFHTRAFSDNKFLEDVFAGYKAVIIDEAQDNDMMFFSIITKAMQSNYIPVCVAVGDPNQSIYAFKSPVHFDIMSYAGAHPEHLHKNYNITVQNYSLDQTFRFGHNIARFTNALYSKANILGSNTKDSAIFPFVVTPASAANIVKNINSNKHLKGALVCRTNSEAIAMLISLRKLGCDGAKLHSSVKSDFAAFYKDGLSGINDEGTRTALSDIFIKQGIQNPTAEQIGSNNEARAIIQKNGFGQLLNFDRNDLENYVMKASRSRVNFVITTAHQSKGAEFDYVIVAGDFFKKQLSTGTDSDEDLEILMNDPYVSAQLHHNRKLDASFLFGSPTETIETGQQEPQRHGKLIDLLSNQENKEEANTFYVAITRAKIGVFFMDSDLGKMCVEIAKTSKSEIGYDDILSSITTEYYQQDVFTDEQSIEDENENLTTRSLFDI